MSTIKITEAIEEVITESDEVAITPDVILEITVGDKKYLVAAEEVVPAP